MNITATMLADFYKLGHRIQYPKDTEYTVVNWTPRSCRIPGVTEVKHFGLKYLIDEYLISYFNENFFNKDVQSICEEYQEFVQKTLGIKDVSTSHLVALWELQYFPIKIYSIPEGFGTPINCPSMVMVNTLPEFFGYQLT